MRKSRLNKTHSQVHFDQDVADFC